MATSLLDELSDAKAVEDAPWKSNVWSDEDVAKNVCAQAYLGAQLSISNFALVI